jgi:membrane protease YdiL (CAAX protease family)
VSAAGDEPAGRAAAGGDGAGATRSGAAPTAALVGWLVLVGVEVALAFASQSSDNSAGGTVLYSWSFTASSVVIYSSLIALTFWIGSAYRSPSRALGLVRFEWRWLGWCAAVVVATVVVGRLLEPLLHAGEKQGFAPDRWEPEHATAFAVNAAIAVTLVPFAEELFFRGAGVRVLSMFGSAVAIGGTALAFSLAHGILAALPVLLVLAGGLAWVRLRSGSVLPTMIAHGAYNGVAVLVLYVSLQT